MRWRYLLPILAALWATPSHAVMQCEYMGDANYVINSDTTQCIFIGTAFTAPRTLTLPVAGATQLGQGGANIRYADGLTIIDIASAVSPTNTLTIAPSPGNLLHGASPVITEPGAYTIVYPLSGSDWWVTTHGTALTPAGGTAGQVQYNNAGVLGGFTTSGDATINTGTGVLTLSTVNANVGGFGSATTCITATVNAKGLITAISAATCTPALGSITGLGTGVATALAINVGTAGAFVTNGGALGTPSSGVATNLTGTAAGLTAGTATNVAVGGITGAGAGCITWLTTPSSTNLRGCLTDESGTGVAYFQGGDLGTPSAGVASNLTALNATQLTTGTIPAARTNGHQNGTATNDNAAAGEVGEYQTTSTGNNNANATVTITIATPAVITWTSHGFCFSGAGGACGTTTNASTAIKFTTTGALPTGITAGTTYYLKAIDANTFNIATSCANALAGTFVATSGTQSGVHTGDIRISMTTAVAQDVACISLGAGDWDISGQMLKGAGATTTVTFIGGNLSLTSNTVDRTFGRRLSFQYGGLVLGADEFTVFDFASTRFPLSTTTSIFLVANDTFATSTMASSGWIRTQRTR